MKASEVIAEIRKQSAAICANNHGIGGNRVYLGKSEAEAFTLYNSTMVNIECYYKSDKKKLMGMDLYIVDTEEPHIFVAMDN